MIKRFFTVAALTIIGFSSFGQEANKFRVGVEIGAAIPKGGGGFLFAIEPKYNLKDNLNVGIRWELAAMAKAVTIDAQNDITDATFSAHSCFIGTIDHYFSKGDHAFAPYVGAGLGLYTLGNISASSSSSNVSSGLALGNKLGGMVRAGFEAGKFRMGAEYNIVPASDYNLLVGGALESINNSYLGISIGLFIGGGQWNHKAVPK